MSAERRSQPATMSALPATASPLLRPRSRSSWLMLAPVRRVERRQSCSNLRSASQRVSTLPENVLQQRNPRSRRETREKRKWLIRSWCGRRRAPIVDKLNSGEVTPLDLLDVLERRIAEVDGKVNALPTLCFDRARDPCQGADAEARWRARPARGTAGADQGPDRCRGRDDHAGLADLQGQYSRRAPTSWSSISKAMARSIYAKSNTPEFGAGANTFNEVFGATRNPWDISRSAAGSSGGAAVALATGMAWLAHGSDMGGSLRNPASFCGIVGIAAEHRPRRAYAGRQDRSQSRRAGPDGAQCRGPCACCSMP